MCNAPRFAAGSLTEPFDGVRIGVKVPRLGETFQGAAKLGQVRHRQVGYINAQVKQALAAGEPAISVDTKKKEPVGDFKNAGREYRPKGQPEPVRVHDFMIPELGRAAPYGVYAIADNAGWVSLGIDYDTASFAVNAIRRW